MTEYVFRCGYCGQEAALDKARLTWVDADNLPGGRVLVIPVPVCDDYCATQINTDYTTGRG